MISGQFAINIHIIVLLNTFEESYLNSAFIAGSLNINPVLVRKEIQNLKKHQFIISKEGKNGGVQLSEKGKALNFNDIFKMLAQPSLLGFAKNTPNPQCPIGSKINEKLQLVYQEIDEEFSKKLKKINIKTFSKQF